MNQLFTITVMSLLLMPACYLGQALASSDEPAIKSEEVAADGVDDSWLLPENNPHIHEKTVQFEPEAFGTTLINGVVRGDRDVYILNAKAGQQLTLTMASIEDNAAFDVLSPGKAWIVDEATDAAISLPETGNYKVVVGGTRGNASYTLNVMVR